MRILHRLPLQADDRFRLIFRPRPGITIAPSAAVLECTPLAGPAARGEARATFVSRARFVDLPDSYVWFFTRYVDWLLKQGARRGMATGVHAARAG